jgi:hypothetical protein
MKSELPIRIGLRWDNDEIDKLLASIKSRKSIPDIAMEHQRTEKAIEFKIKELSEKYFLEDYKLIEATFQDTPEHLKMELKNEIRKKYQENFAAFLELENN